MKWKKYRDETPESYDFISKDASRKAIQDASKIPPISLADNSSRCVSRRGISIRRENQVQSPRTASDAANAIRISNRLDSRRARICKSSFATDVVETDMAIPRIKSWPKIRDVDHRPANIAVLSLPTISTRALIYLDSVVDFSSLDSFLNSKRDIVDDRSGCLTR